MKVFLSWSGARSKAIATSLRSWLPKVIQSIEPWMSDVDIERGARWSAEIAGELQKAQFGIICVTPDNLNEPWIHFEAGALSKTVDQAFVCPYIYELEPTDLVGPLVQFNAARTTRDDTEKLVVSLNTVLDPPLSIETLSESFEMWWPKLEEIFAKIPAVAGNQTAYERPEREIIGELLELAREQSKDVNALLNLSLPGGDEMEDFIVSPPQFMPGAHVRHEKFGLGMVLRREGKGANTKLTISFPGFGQKQLIEKFANLKLEK